MKQRNEDSHWSKPRPHFVAGERSRRLTANSRNKNKHHVRREQEAEERYILQRVEDSMRKTAKKRAVPPWVLPLVVLGILLVILAILPRIINTMRSDQGHGIDEESNDYVAIYSDQVQVISVPVATVYAQPDIKADRICQLLLNTPVETKEEPEAGFIFVTTLDGKQGYIRPDNLCRDKHSAEPDLYKSRVIITDMRKSVMSHASNGNLLMEVKRGTVLYVLYDGADLMRVQLPGGREGWVSATGLFKLPSKVEIPVTDHEAFASYISGFDQTRYMEHGITNEGADMPGLISVTGYINGLNIPSDLGGLIQTGTQVPNAIDSAGYLDTKLLRSGDIIFFADKQQHVAEGETPVITKVGVWLGDEQILTDSQRIFSITRQAPNQILANWTPVRVTRYFEQ